MTEAEKALYADVCWMKQVLEELRQYGYAAKRDTLAEAAKELRFSLKGVGLDA